MRPFTITVALLLGLAVAVNALAAWDRGRHEARLRAASASFRTGQAVLGYRNMDERRFQRARLESIPTPRVVTFGSSRVMEISTALAGVAPGAFYNAGMSAATVEDFIALWSILERQGKRPDAAWFSVDAWALNEAKEEVRWLAWADEVSGFLVRAGAGASVGGPVPEALFLWYRAKELVSWTVLRTSATDVRRLVAGRRRHGAEVQQALEGSIVAEAGLGPRRGLRADGSIVYEAEYRDLPAARTREEAIRYVTNGRTGLEGFRPNTERAARLELLWTRMRAAGVRVVVWLPPYHPDAWRLIQADPARARALAEVRSLVERAATRTGARFTDLSDPASIGCGEADFYDAIHARPACLRRLIARATASGGA
jgi:hypothetical protein